MSGKLYLVGTPIGNLGDISPRAAQVLGEADFIAAEDTRVTAKLLSHLEIRKPMVSYHEHNKMQSGEKICQRIQGGETCALVSDAGMPAISDPGQELCALCAAAGIEVTVIPGPCAAVCALALSGLPVGKFVFEGFLPASKSQRQAQLAQLREEKRAIVFYEAPHKLAAALADMAKILGDRRVALCRELTKLHEETVRTTLQKAAEKYAAEEPRGEFVLVVEGASESAGETVDMEEALRQVQERRSQGASLKDAVKQVALVTGISKNELYDAAIAQK